MYEFVFGQKYFKTQQHLIKDRLVSFLESSEQLSALILDIIKKPINLDDIIIDSIATIYLCCILSQQSRSNHSIIYLFTIFIHFR